MPYLSVSDAAAARGIAFCSASKTFNLAGLHCVQIVTASDEAAALIGRLPFLATHCAHLGAIGAVAAFRRGDEWLEDVLDVLDHSRALLTELLAEHLPEAGYTPPRVGYLAWLDLHRLDLEPERGRAYASIRCKSSTTVEPYDAALAAAPPDSGRAVCRC